LLPTFGKLNFQLDLTDYDIIEIVLIDKKTHSPITGASSNASVSAENSMEYLVALHDFKSRIKDNTEEIDPSGDILTSDSGKVHAMLFDLANNYLLITSFSSITDERKELLFQLILKFAQSTTGVSPTEPKPEPIVEEVVKEPIVIAEVAPQPTSKTEEVEIFEEIPVVEAEPVQVEDESSVKKEKIVITEVVVEPKEIVPEPEPISEIMEAVKEDIEEYPPVPEKLEEAVELPETPVVEKEEIIQEESLTPSPESLDMKLKQQFSDIVEEREVKIEKPSESITPPIPQVVKVVEEVTAQDTISETEVVEEAVPEPEPVVVMEDPSPEPVQEEASATDIASSSEKRDYLR
ncbi:MAG: hypothetical protein ACTSQC_12665, partial [Candidatus Heimdallarchaeaceae archaeon]